MVDIQSTAAEISRGKKRKKERKNERKKQRNKERKKERRKIEITAQKYNGLPYYIGRP